MSESGKIIIVGAGTVGTHISDLLQEENREVVLVDTDKDKLEEISGSMDVQTLLGHGSDPSVLRTAGVENAQLVLAMTNVDEANLLIGFTAKKLGAEKCVVRARSPWCLDTSIINLHANLGIDLILNPEQLAATEIIRFLAEPGALALAKFAYGKVQLRSFVIDESSKLGGKALKECRLPRDVLVAVVTRDGSVMIPNGETRLEVEDKITIIGKAERLPDVQTLFHKKARKVQSVAIAGGGITGLFLAEVLERQGYHVKILEADMDRCEYLSERLDHAQVVHGDATDKGFMKEERIGNSNVYVAVTGDDENNLMSCLLAKELGVEETATSIARPDYATLIQRFGISLAVSPRSVMAEQVLTLVRGGRVRKMALLEEGRVEVIELVAEYGSPMVGKPLSTLSVPEGALISTIVHLGRTTVPRGDSVIEPGDTVIAIGLAEAMDQVEASFRGD